MQSNRRTTTPVSKIPSLACALFFAFTGSAFATPLASEASKVNGREAAVRQVYRAYFQDINQARAIAHSQFETLESKYELGYMVVQANPSEVLALRARGFRLTPDPQWLARQLAQNRSASQAWSAKKMLSNQLAATAFAGIPNYTCYPTVEEVALAANALVTAKPNLASMLTIGQSWQKTVNSGGYDLRVLKLTNTATSGVNGVKPKLFMHAGIHAREYTTTPLALEFAKKLVNGYGVDADMTWILDHHEVHILLVSNPDGRKKAETGLSWRKNTNTNYCGATSNARGADLNRNFGFDWGSTSSGSSGVACDETYRGPSKASEPEVQAIEAYIRSLWADKRGPNRGDAAPNDTSGIHLDIHSHGRLVMWPWGSNGTPTGNDVQFSTLGRKFAYFNGHTPQRANQLYETDGASRGTSYGELGVAAFTFELGTAFFESCSYYNNTILPGNLPALIYAAKVVRTPYITPSGPDSYALSVSKNGAVVNLKASFDDTRFNQSNGTETVQTIAGAEYYLDTPPWVAGATPVAMTAVDGSFNSGIEQAQASIDTSNWSVGKHTLFVRGKDSLGNWGVVSAIFVNTAATTPPSAAFTANVSGSSVNFTDQSTDDGSIVSRSWNFGDGSTGTGSPVVRNYAAAGTYNVSLTVVDNDGNSANTSKAVTVLDDGVEKLVNQQTVGNISLAKNAWRYFKITLPLAAKNLTVSTSGGQGDIDLFTQYGSKPSATAYSCKKAASGNAETCTVAAPQAGTLYIGLFGYAASSGASLKVTYTP